MIEELIGWVVLLLVSLRVHVIGAVRCAEVGISKMALFVWLLLQQTQVDSGLSRNSGMAGLCPFLHVAPELFSLHMAFLYDIATYCL